jgi:chemotaxis response regulator CheB
VLFQSAAGVPVGRQIGLIATGMGRDGVGWLQRRSLTAGVHPRPGRGDFVVYGMNKAAFLEGASRPRFALDDYPTSARTSRRLRELEE